MDSNFSLSLKQLLGRASSACGVTVLVDPAGFAKARDQVSSHDHPMVISLNHFSSIARSLGISLVWLLSEIERELRGLGKVAITLLIFGSICLGTRPGHDPSSRIRLPNARPLGSMIPYLAYTSAISNTRLRTQNTGS